MHHSRSKHHMATKDISILIKATDAASKDLANVGKSLDAVSKSADHTSSSAKNLREHWMTLATAAAAGGIALRGFTDFLGDSIQSSNRLQAALTGLNSVARAFNQDATRAKVAAQNLAADGLMSVTDAATGLKNLLASGFSLDQAVTLMQRFKDSAAFGRQSALSFGQAVASATEGIKNGNSILVDNAGVTKNLSIMLTEAGYSAQDLMKASTDAGVRQAIFAGILRETNAQLGDAGRLADSAAGQQQKMAARTEELKAKLGDSLQPALARLLETVTPMVERFAQFVEHHPRVTAAITLITLGAIGLTTILGTLGVAIVGIGPLFTALSAVGTVSIGVLTAGFNVLTTSVIPAAIGRVAALQALIASPIGFGAIAIGGALAALAAVHEAANRTKNAIDGARRAAEAASRSNDEVIKKLKVMSGAPFSPEVQERSKKALAGLAAGGAFAKGTDFAPGGVSLVGEEGPELVNLPRGARVIPAPQTKQLLSGAAAGTTNNFYNTYNVYSELDLQASNRELGWALANA